MKKYSVLSKIPKYLLLGLGISFCVAGPAEIWADELRVQVRNTAVRSQPKVWSNALGFVNYGDSVELLGSEQGWMKVQFKGKQGFVHATALTKRNIVLSGKTAPKTASRDDVVLAGKGFNREVEKQMASSNATLNFNAVNEIEKMRVSSVELAAFIKGGKLNG
jgi:hypothetical protein